MSNILITVGPQCSGNHLWTKIFNMHPDVNGWDDLNKQYFIRFIDNDINKIFVDDELVHSIDWDQYDNHSLNVSWPFAKGIEPNIIGVYDRLKNMGHDVQIAIIGRDESILKYSQTKRGMKQRLNDFISFVDELIEYNPTFLSYELLYLYRYNYLRQLQLIIPIDYTNVKQAMILKDDSNKLYTSMRTEPTIELYDIDLRK